MNKGKGKGLFEVINRLLSIAKVAQWFPSSVVTGVPFPKNKVLGLLMKGTLV